MGRRKRATDLNKIPPSAETVAKAQIAAEEQKRADSCLRIVNAALAEYNCRIIVSRSETSETAPQWGYAIYSNPSPAPEK